MLIYQGDTRNVFDIKIVVKTQNGKETMILYSLNISKIIRVVLLEHKSFPQFYKYQIIKMTESTDHHTNKD